MIVTILLHSGLIFQLANSDKIKHDCSLINIGEDEKSDPQIIG
jgi:hypothetical protein